MKLIRFKGNLMKKFKVASGQETPEIILDASRGKLRFSGKSHPNDVKGFYNPVITWLREYTANPSPKTIVEFNMEYYSSATSSVLLHIFMELKKVLIKEQKLVIRWFFDEEDEETREAGENYSKITDIPFEYISK